MRINSIKSINYNNKINFKHTAVPYPEYEQSYNKQENFSNYGISGLFKKVSDLFSPEITKKAVEIKSGIDTVYSNPNNKAASVTEKQILSVLV